MSVLSESRQGRTKADTKTVVREVHEWAEFVQLASTKPEHGDCGSGWDAGDKAWAGGSHAQAVKRATGEGFSEAIPEAERYGQLVSDHVIADRLDTTFQARYDVAGAEVDVSRYLSGEPECLIESEPIRLSRAGRAVRIAIPVCYSSSTDTEQILARGAAVYALSDVLARAQHPLEVWATIGIHGSRVGRRASWAICVQHANEPLDEGRLLYALAHPSLLRRLGFCLEDHQQNKTLRQEFGAGAWGGYGHFPYDCIESDLPEAEGTTIILPYLEPGTDWTNEAHVEEWIEEQLDIIFRD